MNFFHKFLAVFLILFLSEQQGFGQNLVINGGFEEDSTTQWGFSKKTGWFQLYSADLFHLKVPGPFISIDHKRPFSGRGFAGLYVGGYNYVPGRDSNVTHEYLIGKLSTPLTSGTEYDVSFWTKPSGTIFDPPMMYTTDRIGATFLSDTSELRKNTLSFAEIVLAETISNEHGTLYDFVHYQKISGCYQATGGEKFIVIGNLHPEKDNVLAPLSNQSMYKNAYFIVDEVQVRAKQVLSMPSDTFICEKDSLSLIFDTSLFSNLSVNGHPIGPIYHITAPGIYDFEADFGACPVQHRLWVDQEQCDYCDFFIPNVITPNADQINDRVSLASNCQIDIIQATVFDRWGEKVYSAKGEFDWGGDFRGSILPPGTYVYCIEALLSGPRIQEQTLICGDVTLIR